MVKEGSTGNESGKWNQERISRLVCRLVTESRFAADLRFNALRFGVHQGSFRVHQGTARRLGLARTKPICVSPTFPCLVIMLFVIVSLQPFVRLCAT